MSRLRVDQVTLGYDTGPAVVRSISLQIPDGRITCVVGPNACGKSTLLRALSRLLQPRAGRVILDGQAIHRQPTKEVARRLGLLPQSPTAPEGLTVEDLVARGRYPHQRLFRQWQRGDEEAVERALELTRTVQLRDRLVDHLSGGQRQRVWIAMALAQDTPIMLLDEPTTFLDIAHQLEVLDLLAELNRTHGRTIVMVLHDLNQAARHSHHLVAMHDGEIAAEGPPAEVVTTNTVRRVFGVDSRILDDPVTGTPLVVPVGRSESSSAIGEAATGTALHAARARH
ncbi:MAG: ABC transporter ATP-binding protein [Actinobacteria bacterium]|nr:ABC transporter ATP-binding protein [Actinomycetota bacterium]